MSAAERASGATSSGPLRATLAELASVDALSSPASEPPAPLEPLPSYDLPSDRRVVTTRDLAVALGTPGARAHHATGIAGSAAGLVVRAAALRTARRIIALTADADGARALAADVSFLLGEHGGDDDLSKDTLGRVLLFLPNESSPYAEVNPDRRGAQARLATLFHLAVDLPWRVLVCPIAALARRVVPREAVIDHSRARACRARD